MPRGRRLEQTQRIAPQEEKAFPEQPTRQHENFFKKWGSLVVLGLGLAIIIIDTTLLNVSLATIIREFSTDIQSIQWVITAYSLTLAALTITGGRIGDLFGRKRMFMAGAAIFAVGSFIASISHNIPTMLAGESIIEGIGAALMMPATASLLVANFRGRDRAVAFGVWGGLAGASSAIGPILGGWLTKNYSWRWGFRINVFVAAVLILGSILLVRESIDTEEKHTIDWVGVLLSGLGLLGIVFGIIESSTYGWWIAKQDFLVAGHNINILNTSIVPYSLILGVMFLNLFYEWERKMEREGRTPLVSMKIFSNRMFTLGVTTTAIVTLALTGMIFTLPVFLQSVLRLDALETGLALVPLSATMLIAAPLSGFLSSKLPAKYLILGGLLIQTLAMFVLRASIATDATTRDLIPGLILFGAGMGMVMAQISNLTLSAVSVQQAGEASGINNTLRQVGSSLGSAIIGAVLLSLLTSNVTRGIQNSTAIPSALKAQFVETVSHQTSNIQFGGGAKLNGTLPQPLVDEITNISHQATVDSVKISLLYAAFFSFLGFVSAFFLPNVKGSSHDPHSSTGH